MIIVLGSLSRLGLSKTLKCNVNKWTPPQDLNKYHSFRKTSVTEEEEGMGSGFACFFFFSWVSVVGTGRGGGAPRNISTYTRASKAEGGADATGSDRTETAPVSVTLSLTQVSSAHWLPTPLSCPLATGPCAPQQLDASAPIYLL